MTWLLLLTFLIKLFYYYYCYCYCYLHYFFVIIPPYSRVHQISWTGVFWSPCSSSPLRGPRNLRGIFAGCVLFSVVLLFGVDLVKFYQALRFLDVLRDLWVWLPGLRSSPALLLPSFPKVFLLRFSGLGT